jgi:hypothetical protein
VPIHGPDFAAAGCDNQIVFPRFFISLLPVLTLLVAACGSNLHNKDAVRQGIIDHLSARKNLDLNMAAIDLEVTSVSFRENEADATVSFKARGSSGSGMQMKYTLERAGSLWKVKAKAEAEGNPHGTTPQAPPQGELPAGHPPLGEAKK